MIRWQSVGEWKKGKEESEVARQQQGKRNGCIMGREEETGALVYIVKQV